MIDDKACSFRPSVFSRAPCSSIDVNSAESVNDPYVWPVGLSTCSHCPSSSYLSQGMKMYCTSIIINSHIQISM